MKSNYLYIYLFCFLFSKINVLSQVPSCQLGSVLSKITEKVNSKLWIEIRILKL